MLLPREIPTETLVAEWSARQDGWGLATLDSVPPNSCALRRMLEILPSAGRPAEARHSETEDLAHDAYFHVRRVEQDAPLVFIRMAVAARLAFHREVEEAPVTIPQDRLEQIDSSLAALLASLLGGGCYGAPTFAETRARGAERHAKVRWVRGHQIFAALTQGLIFAFQSMAREMRAGHSAPVQRWTDLAISLLRGSAAAFELTGDFPVEEYANTIRPSMMPPECPVGLSGLMSIDHRVLAQTIKEMKPALHSLHEHEPARHEALAGALSGVYDSHIHVCEKFVGARPSILTEGRTQRSGPSLIEQFRSLRMKPFEHVTKAPRLTSVGQKKAEMAPEGLECPFH